MTRRLFALAVGLVFVATAAEAAPILLGTTGNGTTQSTLVRLDPDTGAVLDTIGAVGYVVNGLTYDASTGTLYGSTAINDSSFNGLITIDMTTGAGTPVGAGWGAAITNVTTNSAGNMYGWWDPAQDDLAVIDKAAGTFVRVGESGVSTAVNGLSFDNAGVLWMVNGGGGIYTVNTATGAATFVGDLGSTAHHGDFNPETGLYYGINLAGAGAKSIIVGNLATQTIVDTLPTVDNLHTLTFVPAAVPEPATLLMIGTGLALAARRRNRTRS